MLELKSSLAKAKHKREVINQNRKIYNLWVSNNALLEKEDFSTFDINYFTGYIFSTNVNRAIYKPITSDVSLFLYDCAFVKNLIPLTKKNKQRLRDYLSYSWNNVWNVSFSQAAFEVLTNAKGVRISPYLFIQHCTFTIEQEKDFILNNVNELQELWCGELNAIRNRISDENRDLFDRKVMFIANIIK